MDIINDLDGKLLDDDFMEWHAVTECESRLFKVKIGFCNRGTSLKSLMKKVQKIEKLYKKIIMIKE